MSTFRLDGTELFFENGVHLGQILMDSDGYYKWWPNLRGGYLDEGFLKAIGAFLEGMNAPYEAEVQAYFAKRPHDPPAR